MVIILHILNFIHPKSFCYSLGCIKNFICETEVKNHIVPVFCVQFYIEFRKGFLIYLDEEIQSFPSGLLLIEVRYGIHSESIKVIKE